MLPRPRNALPRSKPTWPRSATPARALPCQKRFALTSTLIIIPEDTLEEAGITVMVVTTRSSAKAGLIADMLSFVHTFTVGAVSFSAVGFRYLAERSA